MAEIHIERDKRPTWILVILAFLLVGVVAWIAIRQMGADDAVDQAPVSQVTSPAPDSISVAGAPVAVNEYLRYAARHEATDADHAHTYTADGIRRLAAALGAMAERDTTSEASVGSRARMLADRADALQRNPASTEHARYARQAFDAATALIATMPNAGAATTQIDSLRSAAGALDADGLLLPQAAVVQHFFDQAASALRALARPNQT